MCHFGILQCEEVSHFNQLLQWIRVCTRMDRLWQSNTVPKVISFSVHHPLAYRDSDTVPWQPIVGHRQNRRALFFPFFSKTKQSGERFWWSKGEGHSLDSQRDSGFSSLLVCQEFVSQLNPLSTQSSTDLAIYIQYINYNHDKRVSSLNTKSVFGHLCVDLL